MEDESKYKDFVYKALKLGNMLYELVKDYERDIPNLQNTTFVDMYIDMNNIDNNGLCLTVQGPRDANTTVRSDIYGKWGYMYIDKVSVSTEQKEYKFDSDE